MLRLNNKGFAFSTILYGLLIMGIMIIILVLSIMQTNRSTNKEFINEVEQDLNIYGENDVVISPDTSQEEYNDNTGGFIETDESGNATFDVPKIKQEESQNPTSETSDPKKNVIYYRIQLWNVASENGNRGSYLSFIVPMTPGDKLHFTLPKIGDRKNTYAYVNWGCEGKPFCQNGAYPSTDTVGIHYYYNSNNQVKEIRNECSLYDYIFYENSDKQASDYEKSSCLYFDRSNTGDAKASIERIQIPNNDINNLPNIRFNPNDDEDGEGVYFIKNVPYPNYSPNYDVNVSQVLTCNRDGKVYLDFFTGEADQKWEFDMIEKTVDGKKYYKITNIQYGLSLRIAEGSDPTTSGINVDASEFVDMYANNQLTAGLKEWQKWYIDPTEDSRGSIAQTRNLDFYMYTGYYQEKGEGATRLTVGGDGNLQAPIQVKTKENDDNSYTQKFRIYRAEY